MQLNLTKNKIFYGILVFILIVNLLVIFSLDYFYIRAILAFIFLITIPGILIMLGFKIREIGFWEYLVYTVGLSVAFIMFAGLAVNWILPWLNVTDKPLSLWPILISFDFFLLILWMIAYERNQDLKPLKIKSPKLDWTNRIFFIIPMFFPVLSILGAFLLNNHGPNILTMIMLGGIAVYVFCIVLFRKKLNPNVYPWAILFISLAILFSFSMRSWYVNGGDINKEYYVFQLTKYNSLWVFDNFRDTYNAMLSLSIFPTILSLFIKINDHLILKIFHPIIFVFLPLIVYIIPKRYMGTLVCFLASFFFISQEVFFNWTDLPIRQEISLIFFGLMILVLFSKDINKNTKKILFTIFGFSMIVSHYSTTYIALAIFLGTYILSLIYRAHEHRKVKKGKLHPDDKTKFDLAGLLVILLLIFGFLWYTQVTPTADGLVDFTKKSVSNVENMFSEDVQAEGRTPFDQFNLFFKPIDMNKQLEDYIVETKLKINTEQVDGSLSNYNPHIMNSEMLPQKMTYDLSYNIYFLGEFLKKLMKIFIICGFFLIIFSNYRKEDKKGEYLNLLIICFLIFSALLFLPFISKYYSILRAYQQSLICLSPIAVLGSFFIFKILKKERLKIFVILIIFVTFFLFHSDFIPQLVGGIDATMRLNNNLGLEYDIYYTHNEELISANWLFRNYISDVFIDLNTKSKMGLLLKEDPSHFLFTNVFLLYINKNSYVYVSYSNLYEEIMFDRYNGIRLSFNFPTEFINDNKNKIYNNGGSEIFR